MDFAPSLAAKKFFRFTGPPEHWLTAIKFMTWGLEGKYLERWEEIQPGDIFFIHSTANSEFPNARSGVIGLGVIGPDFSRKSSPLWFYELKHNINKWPLLIPLSEVYLFSSLPPLERWEATDTEETKHLIDLILKNIVAIPTGFPVMGSFSSVSFEVAERILNDKQPLHLYTAEQIEIDKVETSEKRIASEKITSASEALRYADTLQVFDSVKARVIRDRGTVYARNNDLLERAESVHATILQQLITLFRKRGYETRQSRFVDLFAHNKERAFLIDVKSTENKNFRSQARKGIAQLLEYEYFDVRRFADENSLRFSSQYKLIVPSRTPNDIGYVGFINSLKIGVARVNKEKLDPVGEDLGFSRI